VRSGWAGAGTRGCATQQLLDGQQALGVNELKQTQLEMEALLLAVVEIVKGTQHDLQVAGDLFFGEEKGGASGAGAFVAGDLEELGLFAAEFGHERIAEIANQLAGEG